MNSAIIISSRVIDTIKSLPETERKAIATALSAELILGADPDETLNSFQSMLYSIIRFYVKRDSERLLHEFGSESISQLVSV